MTVALLGFALAATLLILAPGPDTMLVVRNSLRGGRRVGLCTSAGTVTGLLVWALAATLGITSLVAASRVGYDVLRLVGAAYLIWLGANSLWPRHRGGRSGEEPGRERDRSGAPPIGLRRAYVNGAISNLCNPKIGAFFVAFLPAFIPAGTSARGFSLLLGIWFALETGIWLGALVWMIDRGVGWLTRAKIQRRLERLTGVLLIGFGLRLATESR
jgi:threonine/homoserine/homoserine lactone efflux protein